MGNHKFYCDSFFSHISYLQITLPVPCFLAIYDFQMFKCNHHLYYSFSSLKISHSFLLSVTALCNIIVLLKVKWLKNNYCCFYSFSRILVFNNDNDKIQDSKSSFISNIFYLGKFELEINYWTVYYFFSLEIDSQFQFSYVKTQKKLKKPQGIWRLTF